MLSVRKFHLVTGLKVAGLEVRKAELDFYILRYIMTAGISTIWAGLSYVGLLKIELDDYIKPNEHKFALQIFIFYTCGSITMACSMYNLLLCTFLVVNAQGFLLQGPPNAIHRCVQILASNWKQVRFAVVLSVASLMAAGLSVLWIKVDGWMQRDTNQPRIGMWRSDWTPTIGAIASSALVLGTISLAIGQICRMARELSIAPEFLVGGDLTLMLGPGDDPTVADAAAIAAAENSADGGGMVAAEEGSGVAAAAEVASSGSSTIPAGLDPSVSQLSQLPPQQRVVFDLIAEGSSRIAVGMTRETDEPAWQ